MTQRCSGRGHTQWLYGAYATQPPHTAHQAGCPPTHLPHCGYTHTQHCLHCLDKTCSIHRVSYTICIWHQASVCNAVPIWPWLHPDVIWPAPARSSRAPGPGAGSRGPALPAALAQVASQTPTLAGSADCWPPCGDRGPGF